MTFDTNILVTGGAGFIGCHVVKRLVHRYPNYRIVNFDLLTYAGNLLNLKEIEHASNYQFIKGDITDASLLEQAFIDYDIDAVIHLAAESHVDRSILDPLAFVRTNILGTVTLLNACLKFWKEKKGRFYHISTDEVYGSLGETGYFTEETAYDPHSPYSASKASSDHFVRAYGDTYGLDVVISNCSNNYGPNQFPEKLIPLTIQHIIAQKEIPVYGKGNNIRDWLWVGDHALAIDLIFHQGRSGHTYNIGGHNEWKNIDVVKGLCTILDQKLNRELGTSEKLIRFVSDRPGHDHRYAIDSTKLQDELGWKHEVNFEKGLELTIDWYLDNQDWVDAVLSGEYRLYYEQQYGKRLTGGIPNIA